MEELINAEDARILTENNAKKGCATYGENLKQELIRRIIRHIERGESKVSHTSNYYIYCLDELIKEQVEQVKTYFISKGYSFEYEIKNYNDYYHYVGIIIEW